MKREFKHEYLMSSERAFDRHDEADNTVYSDNVYQEGDVVVREGLRWVVTRVIK